MVAHSERRYTGFMLVCDDPGPEYKYFAFTADFPEFSQGRVIKSIYITTIDTKRSGVGLCLATVYSPRPGFENWVLDSLQAGFSDIYVYYANARDRTAMNSFYHTSTFTENFRPIELPGVQYFELDPPPRTMLFSESTMYTECIHRHRLKHKYLAMVDADEHFWRRPSSDSLEVFLDKLLPADVASLVMPDILYPETCQEHSTTVSGARPGPDSHFYYPTRIGTQPKSIVRTEGSLIHWVHTLALAEPDFEIYKDISPSIAYWKHVRQQMTCEHDKIYDDRDSSSFHQVMDNDSMWLPSYPTPPKPLRVCISEAVAASQLLAVVYQ